MTDFIDGDSVPGPLAEPAPKLPPRGMDLPVNSSNRLSAPVVGLPEGVSNADANTALMSRNASVEPELAEGAVTEVPGFEIPVGDPSPQNDKR